jgi:Uma2 family endonuclease
LKGEVFMTRLVPPLPAGQRLPDHKDLPETDGSIVQNFQELPQSMLLTGVMRPVLTRLRPDGQFTIGHDSGIYYRQTEPPLDGCKAPDWFCVLDVPPLLNGEVRRSYVLWQEHVPPVLVIEFVSGDGSEERDTTPETGKFWVYERAVGAPYYAIYEVDPGRVELFRLVDGRYERVEANERGHFPVEPLGVELGIWQGVYQSLDLPWLRCWDQNGVLLPSLEERIDAEKQRAEAHQQRADAERQRAEQEKQRGDAERQRADAQQQRADAEHQRAEQEKQRADRLAERMRALGIDPTAEV